MVSALFGIGGRRPRCRVLCVYARHQVIPSFLSRRRFGCLVLGRGIARHLTLVRQSYLQITCELTTHTERYDVTFPELGTGKSFDEVVSL